jgi:phenylacetate 2-hydroxylase
MVTEQLVGTSLPESFISHLAYNETNIFRQRTIASPARDYVPLMRVWDRIMYNITSTLGMQYGRDEKEEAAKKYRRLQQIYITDLLAGLRERIDNGDGTPSILGNIMRSGALKDEEILLASYTGSSYWHILYFMTCPFTTFLGSCCRSQLGILTHVDHWLSRQQPRGVNILL